MWLNARVRVVLQLQSWACKWNWARLWKAHFEFVPINRSVQLKHIYFARINFILHGRELVG